MPEPQAYGVFVNEAGQRFINEDCYHGRVSRYAFDQFGRGRDGTKPFVFGNARPFVANGCDAGQHPRHYDVASQPFINTFRDTFTDK